MANFPDDNTDKMRNSKDYRIVKCSVFTKKGEVTLLNLFKDIEIFESIFYNTLSGSITIIDSNNLQSTFHLEGGEKLEIHFKSAGLPTTKKLDFYIYKISEKLINTDSKASYVIFFSSKEFIRNNTQKISKFFSQMPEKIVEDIVKSPVYGLNTTKSITVEKTTTAINFIPAFWTPLKTINYLCKKSVSDQYTGSPYMFYENFDGFHFKTIANMNNQPVLKEYTYAPKLEVYSKNPLRDRNLVESYSVKNTNDIMDRIDDGFYASKLFSYDLLKKTYKETNISNQIDKKKLKVNHRLNPFPSVSENPVFDDLKLVDNYQQSHRTVYSHSYQFETKDNPSIFNSNYTATETLLQRNATLSELTSQTLILSLSGDSELFCGSTIQFSCFLASRASKKEELDQFISGKYLVTAISHKITEKGYNMDVEVCKDSLMKPILEYTK